MRKCRGKRRYRDEIAAKMALASVWRQDSSRRTKVEQRAYKCNVCRGWHLTSAPLKVKCPTCQTLNELGQDYCQECGDVLNVRV